MVLELKEKESMNIKFENFIDTLEGEDLFGKCDRVRLGYGYYEQSSA